MIDVSTTPLALIRNIVMAGDRARAAAPVVSGYATNMQESAKNARVEQTTRQTAEDLHLCYALIRRA